MIIGGEFKTPNLLNLHSLPNNNLETFLLIPREKYSLHPSSKTFCFKDHYKKTQPISMKSCGAQYQYITHLQNISIPKIQSILWKEKGRLLRVTGSGNLL